MKDYNRLLGGKCVFVTADARGIGEDTALLFARQGAQVGVEGRNPEFLARTMEEIRAYSLEGKDYVIEPSSKEQVEQTAGQVLEDMQRVDTLANTVRINVHGRIDECSDELLERILETNYRSGLRFSRRFISGMVERRYGIIINTSSIHSMATIPGFGVCVGTKRIMNATARAMALDYADYGIRVNTICPGLIMSDNAMNRVYDYQEGPERDAFMEMLNHMQPLVPGRVENISDAALYLASDISSYVTGQIVMVDGGVNIKAHQRGREDELL